MIRNSTEQLHQQIKMLEKKQALELQQLQDAFKEAYDNLRLVDMVKTGVTEAVDNSEVKNKVVNNTVGATAGFLAKKILFGNNLGPVKGLLGLALQLGVSSVVANNMDNIKALGKKLINRSDATEDDEDNDDKPKKRSRKKS